MASADWYGEYSLAMTKVQWQSHICLRTVTQLTIKEFVCSAKQELEDSINTEGWQPYHKCLVRLFASSQ